MKLFTNKAVRQLFLAVTAVMGVLLLLIQCIFWRFYEVVSPVVLLLSLLMMGGVLAVFYLYFHRQNNLIEQAQKNISSFLSGDKNARIACDEEGELYKLFHMVNTLSSVLNAQAEQEAQSREFLKGTISNISHQLKTPLAALSIYNGLAQREAESLPEIKEFTMLSEKELDRIETLVQSLLKMTKLDAGSIIFDKKSENLAELINDIVLHFTYRAKQEQKEIVLSGMEELKLTCDYDWMTEAVGNVVKNALDHTKPGGRVQIEWHQHAAFTRITVKDNGNGIHPEDIHHIFKRFYRSRFSQDTQGIGLGLPFSKTIIEAHDGTITVDSILGQGSTFTIGFLTPTKL